MKNLILAGIFSLATLCGYSQTKGDWYVGTGDIANSAWTDWAVSPTIGYGIIDNLMIGMSVSQADSTVDMDLDFHARYFTKGYFVYVATDGLSTDNMVLGGGKMFAFRNNMYIDPKIVYNMGEKTTNLTMGFGFKF